MAVILHRFSTEISSSGLGRRPLTAETRVRVPVSLPSKAFSIRAGGFVVFCVVMSAITTGAGVFGAQRKISGGRRKS